MSHTLLASSILGVIILFILVKAGIKLFFPFVVCVMLATVGMVLFVLTSPKHAPPNNPEIAINSVSIAAMILTVSAINGILLLGVVVIARWFSGNTKIIEKEMAHEQNCSDYRWGCNRWGLGRAVFTERLGCAGL